MHDPMGKLLAFASQVRLKSRHAFFHSGVVLVGPHGLGNGAGRDLAADVADRSNAQLGPQRCSIGLS